MGVRKKVYRLKKIENRKVHLNFLATSSPAQFYFQFAIILDLISFI